MVPGKNETCTNSPDLTTVRFLKYNYKEVQIMLLEDDMKLRLD